MKNLCKTCFVREFCEFAFPDKTPAESCESYRPGVIEVTPANLVEVRAMFMEAASS